MTKPSHLPELNNFYRLPFEKGTFELTEQTLNLHSEFRKPNNFFSTKVRNVSFRNEIFTLGVKLEDEPERLIFMKVTQNELLVSCQLDSHPGYLSRYAYFGLLFLLDFGCSKCFKKYYWPDFFNPLTGKSKFLKIYNDRQGLDIEVKSGFPHFYKPGDPLIDWHKGSESKEPKLLEPLLPDHQPITDATLGYFLADVQLSSIHSNHYPFLIPFLGIPTKDKQRIKSYISFLLNEDDIQTLDITPTQQQLNSICFRMHELAPVEPRNWWRQFSLNSKEQENGKQLMELWHQAKHLIAYQKFVYYYDTHGLNYLHEKPKRDWIRNYSIKNERPQLIVKLLDKGEYYRLELRFRVNRKMHVPEKSHYAFFINGTKNPHNLYLMGKFTDFQLVSFFAQFEHKIAVLKCHFQDEFKVFVDTLASEYKLVEG